MPPTIGQPVADPTPETMRLYAADWTRFAAWCRATKHAALPADPATVAAYLLAVAPCLSRGALGRCRAAIGAMHRQQGLPIPRLRPADHAALRATARPAQRGRAAPFPSAASLNRMAAGCPRDIAGLRDRAFLLLAASCGRSGRKPGAGLQDGATGQEAETVARTALLGLDAEHVTLTAAGAVLQVRRRADDAEPTGLVSLARIMAASCPVRALEDWLLASDTRFGPVFRKVDRWGNVEHARLGPDGWGRIVARRAGVPRQRGPARRAPTA